jgi:hypothetical protein
MSEDGNLFTSENLYSFATIDQLITGWSRNGSPMLTYGDICDQRISEISSAGMGYSTEINKTEGILNHTLTIRTYDPANRNMFISKQVYDYKGRLIQHANNASCTETKINYFEGSSYPEYTESIDFRTGIKVVRKYQYTYVPNLDKHLHGRLDITIQSKTVYKLESGEWQEGHP